MKRLGAVLVFRTGVDREKAAKALEAMKDLLELPDTAHEPVYFTQNGQKRVRYNPVPHDIKKHLLQEFDDRFGSPVWYIP